MSKIFRWPNECDKSLSTVLLEGGLTVPVTTTVAVRFMTWQGPNTVDGVTNGTMDGVIRLRRILTPLELLHESSGLPQPECVDIKFEPVLEVVDSFSPFSGYVLEPGETLPGILGGRNLYAGLYFRGDFLLGTEPGSLSRPVVTVTPDVKIVLNARGADWEYLSDPQLELLRAVVGDNPADSTKFGVQHNLQHELRRYTTRLTFPVLFKESIHIDWWGMKKFAQFS